jgi:peptidoglycan-N-acetylglucosamine deacetylase
MGDVLRTIIYVSVFIGFFTVGFYILTFISSFKRNRPLLKDSELPLASVIIPAWNEEKSVERTMNSILNSDYPSFEVIFVDDGSTDKTYEIAKKYEKDDRVRVFTKNNGGKATALNLGIGYAKGEVIFSMDADTIVDKKAMRKMVRYFKDDEVMSVTPAMLIDNPNTIMRRVQQIEYVLGVFLRKVFATLNAIYIAPGAFTVYRKSFFDKYGGYDVGNITEDMELALRIQSKGYKTENAHDAVIHTTGPPNFKTLKKQRVRWYTGLIKNFWDYRNMVSRNFGDLGLLVMPIGWITISFCIFITFAMLIKSIGDAIYYFSFLNSINFNILGSINYSLFGIESFLFEFLSTPIVIFVIFSMIIVFGYLTWVSRNTDKIKHLKRNTIIFLLIFGPLFCYWWTLSFLKIFFKKKINWR